MTPEAIQQGLMQRCKSTAQSRGLSVALPNVATDPADGQIRFDFIDPIRENDTLKGGGVLNERGQMVVTICVDLNTKTDTASGHAVAIADLFPKAQKFNITGGHITILDVPQIRSGYSDDAVWRVPIAIRYYAKTT
jgi:uncharacterized protein DUF4128